MSTKTDLIKRVASKVASKAKKPVAPAAKKAIRQKMTPYTGSAVAIKGGGYASAILKNGKLSNSYGIGPDKRDALDAATDMAQIYNIRRKVKLGLGTKPHAPKPYKPRKSK